MNKNSCHELKNMHVSKLCALRYCLKKITKSFHGCIYKRIVHPLVPSLRFTITNFYCINNNREVLLELEKPQIFTSMRTGCCCN